MCPSSAVEAHEGGRLHLHEDLVSDHERRGVAPVGEAGSPSGRSRCATSGWRGGAGVVTAAVEAPADAHRPSRGGAGRGPPGGAGARGTEEGDADERATRAKSLGQGSACGAVYLYVGSVLGDRAGGPRSGVPDGAPAPLQPDELTDPACTVRVAAGPPPSTPERGWPIPAIRPRRCEVGSREEEELAPG